MNRFSRCIFKGTPWSFSLFEQKILRNLNGSLPPIRKCARSDIKNYMQKQRYYPPVSKTWRTLWAHKFIYQVTEYQNAQVIVTLIVIGNLICKRQWTRRLLIQCRCRVNRFRNPVYLMSTMIPDLWPP